MSLMGQGDYDLQLKPVACLTHVSLDNAFKVPVLSQTMRVRWAEEMKS